MKRLIIIAALIAVFLTSTVSFAAESLSSSDKSYLFNNANVAVSLMDENEIASTQGEALFIVLGSIVIRLF